MKWYQAGRIGEEVINIMLSHHSVTLHTLLILLGIKKLVIIWVKYRQTQLIMFILIGGFYIVCLKLCKNLLAI